MTKLFGKWAKKNFLSQKALKQAANEMQNGLIDASLGSFLFKKRIGLEGKGKRGSVRTIVFYTLNDKIIFIHGFLKKEKSNLSHKELLAFKSLANIFLTMTNEQFKIAIKNGDFEEIKT